LKAEHVVHLILNECKYEFGMTVPVLSFFFFITVKVVAYGLDAGLD
jgi:hypothetical protein